MRHIPTPFAINLAVAAVALLLLLTETFAPAAERTPGAARPGNYAEIVKQLHLVKDGSDSARRRALEWFIQRPDESRPALESALRIEDVDMVASAAYVLHQIGSRDENVKKILNLAGDDLSITGRLKICVILREYQNPNATAYPRLLLMGKDPALKLLAVKTFEQMNQPDTPALFLKLLQDKQTEPVLRQTIISSLGSFKTEHAFQILCQITQGQNEPECELACASLGNWMANNKSGKSAAEYLLVLMNRAQEKLSLRAAAAKPFQTVEDSALLQLAVASLKTSLKETRELIGNALLQNPSAQGLLLFNLVGQDSELRLEIARLYAQQTPPANALKHLLELLQDTQPEIRRQAALALCRLAHPDSLDQLADFAFGTDAELSAAGRRALAQVTACEFSSRDIFVSWKKSNATTDQKQWMLQALEDARRSPEMKKIAADKLGVLKCPEAVPTLIALTKERDHDAALAALRALGKIANRPALRQIVALLDSPLAGIPSAADAELRRWCPRVIALSEQLPVNVKKEIVNFWNKWLQSNESAFPE